MNNLEVGSKVPIVLRYPFVAPIVAKFSGARCPGDIGIDEAKRPLHMFTEVEKIEEHEEAVDEKDIPSERSRQKKLRTYYRRKDQSKIMLRDHESQTGERGTDGCTLNYEGTKENLTIGGSDKKSANYVLVKLLRKSDGSSEVSMMPVGDWHNFKKKAVQGNDVTLTDVDHAYDVLAAANKVKNKKFKNLLNKMAQVKEEKQADPSAKRGFRQLFLGQGTAATGGDAAEDSSDDELFGDASTKSLTKHMRKKNATAKNPMQEKRGSHLDNWDNRHGDWGIDKEDLDQEFEEGASDDDMVFVEEETKDLEGREEMSDDDKNADEDDDDDTSSDEEEEDNDEPDAFLEAAKGLREDNMTTATAGVPLGKTGFKRKRGKSMDLGSAGALGAADGTGQLSDETVAAFVRGEPGQRVSMRRLTTHFKKAMRAMNKSSTNKKAGQHLFTAIVGRVLNKTKDPATDTTVFILK